MDKPLTTLQTIIIHMNTNEHWHDFICYCKQREAGLRKLAFKHLETFKMQRNGNQKIKKSLPFRCLLF